MKYIENKAANIKSIELIAFIVIWVAIFSVPFFQNRINNSIDWEKVTNEWIRMSSFLIIFILNAYVFVPKFLFKKQYILYLTITFLIIVVILALSIWLRFALSPAQPVSMPPMDLGPGMPPMELGSKMPAPMGFRPPEMPQQKTFFMIFVDYMILAILVVAAGTTFKMISQWLNEEGRRKDVEKEQLKTELALLRHQVSPHFFMNTLNNIHALVDINTEIAKDAIIRLSTLMRYLLYDTVHGQTSLKKEIEFIVSYITLMQLRFSKKVSITVEVPQDIPDIQIPPMLFISFLENAFKHGVSYQASSFVQFKLEVAGNKINCHIKNSKHKSKENLDKSYSGIGLTNIQKSLELLFEKEYSLNIFENDKEFDVNLTIPIYENKMLSH
ncbi:MAG: sensor histidine kinase [Paludibacter sp.]